MITALQECRKHDERIGQAMWAALGCDPFWAEDEELVLALERRAYSRDPREVKS
jgi:hypothetical protein